MNENIPDKKYLYGRYMAHENWTQRLHRKLAHKSLDIPEDDDVYVDNSQKGMTWKELAVLAALGLGGAGAYAYSQKAVVVKPEVEVADSEYDVLFYDKDGNEISVPHISTKPK